MQVSKRILSLPVLILSLGQFAHGGLPEGCTPVTGSAVSFNGGHWIDFGEVAVLSAHTIEAWVKPRVAAQATVVGHLPTGGCSSGTYFWLEASPPALGHILDGMDCGADFVYISVTPALDEWVHLAGTFDGNEMSLYLNGELVGQQTDVSFHAVNQMAAGSYGGTTAFFTGELDEVRIWSVARSQSSIQADMNRKLLGNESNLAGLWHFDAGTGQLAFDSGPACASGIFGGSPDAEPDDPTWVTGVTLCAAETDGDGDTVIDGLDNCLDVANPDQRDTDGDGFGNLCDADLNDDLQINFADLQLVKDAFFSTPATPGWNPDADFDGNDQVNFADLLIIKNLFFAPPGPSGVAANCV